MKQLPSDDYYRDNLVRQTADLRYSVRWEGVRSLLKHRGLDPLKCLLISCDQGDDVAITLALPDGTIVNADFREHYKTRQAIRFVNWETAAGGGREFDIARSLAASDTLPFGEAVHEFYERELREDDRPLRPLNWGDRAWHSWEQRPE